MYNFAIVKNYIETKIIKGNTLSERKINELRAIIKEGTCPAGPKGRLVNFRQKDDRDRNDTEKEEAAQIRMYLKGKLKEIQDLRTANQPKEVEKKEESTKVEIRPQREFGAEIEQENAFQALLINSINNLDYKSLSDNLKALEENGEITYQGEEGQPILHIRKNPQRAESLKKIAKDVKGLVDKEKEAVKKIRKTVERLNAMEKLKHDTFLNYLAAAIQGLDEKTLADTSQKLAELEEEITISCKTGNEYDSILIRNSPNNIKLLKLTLEEVRQIKEVKHKADTELSQRPYIKKKEGNPLLEEEYNEYKSFLKHISKLEEEDLITILDDLKAGCAFFLEEGTWSYITVKNSQQTETVASLALENSKEIKEKKTNAIKKIREHSLYIEQKEIEARKYNACLEQITKAIKGLDKAVLEKLKDSMSNGSEANKEVVAIITSELVKLTQSNIEHVARIEDKKTKLIQEIQESSKKNIVSIKNAEALKVKEAQAFQDKTYVENLIKEYIMQLNYKGLESILERSKEAGELKYSKEGRESIVIAFTPELENLLEGGLKEIQEKIKALEGLIEGKYPDGRMMPLDKRKELLQTILLERKLNKGGKVYIESIPSHWKKLLEAKIEGLKAEDKAVKDKQKEQKRVQLLQQTLKKEQTNSLLIEGSRAQTGAHQVNSNQWITSKISLQEDGSWLSQGSDGSTERIPAIYKIPEAGASTDVEGFAKLVQLKKECEILRKQEEHREERDTKLLSNSFMPSYQIYPKSYALQYNLSFSMIPTLLAAAEDHPGPLESQIEQYARIKHLLTIIAELLRIPRECIDLGQYMLKLEQTTWHKKLSEKRLQRLKLLNEEAVSKETIAWSVEDFEISKQNCTELKKLLQERIEVILEGREEIRLKLEQEIVDLSKAIEQLQEPLLKQETAQPTALDRATVDQTTTVILDQISREIITHESLAANVQGLPPEALVPTDELRTELVKRLIAKRKELQALKELDAPEDLPLTARAKQFLGITDNKKEEATPTASLTRPTSSSYDGYKGQVSSTNFDIPASKQIPVEFEDKKTEEVWDKLDSQYQQKLLYCSDLRDQREVLLEEEKQLYQKCNTVKFPESIRTRGEILHNEIGKTTTKMARFSETGLPVEKQIKIYTKINANLRELIEIWKLAPLIKEKHDLKNYEKELGMKSGGKTRNEDLGQRFISLHEKITLVEEKSNNPSLGEAKKIFPRLNELYKERIDLELELIEEVILYLEKEITQLEVDICTIENTLANENCFDSNNRISLHSFSRIQAIMEEKSSNKQLTPQSSLDEAIPTEVLQKILNELTTEIAARQEELKGLREIDIPEGLVLNPKSYELISSIILTAAAAPGPSSTSLAAPKATAKLSKQQEGKKLNSLEEEFRTLQQAHEDRKNQTHKLPVKLANEYQSLNTTKTNKIKEPHEQKEISKKIEIYEVLISTVEKLKEFTEVAELIEEGDNLSTHAIELSEGIEGQLITDSLNINVKALSKKIADKRVAFEQVRNPSTAKEILLELKESCLKLVELLLEARLELTRCCEKKIEGLISSLELVQSMSKHPDSYEKMPFSGLAKKLKGIAATKDYTFNMFEVYGDGAPVSSEVLLTYNSLKKAECNIEHHLEEVKKELEKLKEVNIPVGLALTDKSYELIKNINNTKYKESKKEPIAVPSSSLASASVNKLDKGPEKA